MVNVRTGSDDEFAEERERDIDSDEEEEDIEIDEPGLDDLKYQPPAMLKQSVSCPIPHSLNANELIFNVRIVVELQPHGVARTDKNRHSWRLRRIDELVEMMEGPDLILDPAYQRNVVWQKERMTRLINSLMANYYVPPLILNVKQIPSGDGKEKLQSKILLK